MSWKKGFTLIELLVVIAIIALLLSVLLPALSTVKQRAKVAVCKAHFHQWGISARLYAGDNDGWYPSHNINAATGENTWDIGYRFVLEMHDNYDIPYKMFFCPAQEQSKYPGDDISAFRRLMWYSLADQNDPYSTELSPSAALATLRFSWWIPRKTSNNHWIPVEFGDDSTIEPRNGAPRRDIDDGHGTKPIMTDFCMSDILGTTPKLDDIDYGGHWLRGKFDSVNLLYGDGHVDIHRENHIQPRFTSRQSHHWW